jgi:cytochrome c553
MKYSQIFLVLAMGVLGAGCSNIERSRDLANPQVSATTLVQQVCSLCHGIDGNSVSPIIPRLAGQSPDYIAAQLGNFRSHQRSDPPGYEYMWGLTRNLTDEQIKGLADYFSSQKPIANAAMDAQLMAAGKVIFENGVPEKEAAPCMACHGPTAQGMATFPRLAGQHQDYLVKQLHVFQETEGRPGTPMKQITHLLSDQEMEAVASYLQAFPASP